MCDCSSYPSCPKCGGELSGNGEKLYCPHPGCDFERPRQVCFHPDARPGEVWERNAPLSGISTALLSLRHAGKCVRVGKVAFGIQGNALPHSVPLFVYDPLAPHTCAGHCGVQEPDSPPVMI